MGITNYSLVQQGRSTWTVCALLDPLIRCACLVVLEGYAGNTSNFPGGNEITPNVMFMRSLFGAGNGVPGAAIRLMRWLFSSVNPGLSFHLVGWMQRWGWP